jgi:hypothetical protein
MENKEGTRENEEIKQKLTFCCACTCPKDRKEIILWDERAHISHLLRTLYGIDNVAIKFLNTMRIGYHPQKRLLLILKIRALRSEHFLIELFGLGQEI